MVIVVHIRKVEENYPECKKILYTIEKYRVNARSLLMQLLPQTKANLHIKAGF